MSEEMKKQKARENARRYYQKNKQKVLAKQKEYVKKKYATDEEFRKKTYERSRKYVKNNIEKVREWKRKWANKHYKELREKGLLPPSKQEVIEDLQQKVEQLENIRKEAIEYIENNWITYNDSKDFTEFNEELPVFIKEINILLNILNKGSNKE